jgi:hypothetical protein
MRSASDEGELALSGLPASNFDSDSTTMMFGVDDVMH